MPLSPGLQQLHVVCWVALHWMVFLKTRPSVKWNNKGFTNLSGFPSLLMCSTHFTLSCRILHFSLPTSNNFLQFMYSEIPGESAWRVMFRSRWCCLLLWQLKIIWTWITSILDFWYPGTSYLVQEVLWHSVQQNSSGLILRTSRSGSDMTYSCHHNLSRFTFPIFVPFVALLCLPFITMNHAAYILIKDTNTFA